MSEQENSPGGNSPGWLTISDGNENAFTLQMPGGWQNQAALVRVYDQVRNAVTSRSPDGGTLLFVGDPSLPTFLEPGTMPATSPMTQVHPFVPADVFFRQNVCQRYGHRTGFHLTSIGPSPAFERFLQDGARKHGGNIGITAARIAFDYINNGVTMHTLLHGISLSYGEFWIPDASGIITRGDPTRFEDMLIWMAGSYQTNPQWRQNQDQQHAQKMIQIQTNHQSAVSAMQSGHQGRMDAIRQTGAANTQIFHERQAAIDANHQAFRNAIRQPVYNAYSGDGGQNGASHERFINYIRGEETVVGAGGQNYQVEAGQDRYYVNASDNTYIGTDGAVERDDLHARFGVNPEGYEEARVRK